MIKISFEKNSARNHHVRYNRERDPHNRFVVPRSLLFSSNACCYTHSLARMRDIKRQKRSLLKASRRERGVCHISIRPCQLYYARLMENIWTESKNQFKVFQICVVTVLGFIIRQRKVGECDL